MRFPIVLLALVSLSFAQPVMEWNKTYGGTGYENIWTDRLEQTVDNGYIIAAYTSSLGAGGSDAWLIKTDSNGNEQWNRTYGSPDYEDLYDVWQTPDNGYIAAGTTESGSPPGGGDVWVIKTNPAGDVEWNMTYGYNGSTYDWPEFIQQTTDNGYIIGAVAQATYNTVWLIKTDENGIVAWNATYGYGGSSDNIVNSGLQTSDGGYAMAGYTNGAGSYDFWLVKTDANGNEEWNQTYGGINYDMAFSVQQTSDGGFVLAGYTQSFGAGSADFWLVKTDENGTMQWNQTYGGTGSEYAYSIQRTSDNGYILAGITNSFGVYSIDFWLVKTDANGNEEWNQTYGGTDSDYAYSVQQTPDNGYALAGITGSFGAGSTDIWLIKLSNPSQTPTIEFIQPTPEDNSTIYSDSIYINTSITGTGNLSAFIDFNRSLVGYWSFDNISGDTVYDSSTYGNNGTNYGTVNASGKFGNALDFDGVDDYVEVPHNESLNFGAGDFTVEAWIKTEDPEYDDQGYIVFKGDWSPPGFRNLMALGVYDGTVELYLEDGSGVPWSTGMPPLDIFGGEWHYIVVKREGNKLSLLIDGIVKGESIKEGFGSPDNNYNLTFGMSLESGGPFYFFNGSIDEVRIWNRALSEEEINASYNAGVYRLERNFTDLTEGNYSFYAYAIDSFGNYNTTETRTVTIEETLINYSISSCINITNSGNYTLVQNLSSSGTCIGILSDNVNLDCVGYSINGPSIGRGNYGIHLDGTENNTIKNCVVMDFEEGIYLDSSSNNILTNNTATSNSDVGIFLYSSTNNNLTNNNASSNLWFGIYLQYSSSNNVINNIATLNIDTGIYLYGSSNNTISNNTASSNTYGIHTDHSSANNIITNNTANSNTDVGIYLESSSNSNVISNSTSCNNTQSGYYFDASSTNNSGSGNLGNITDDDSNIGFASSNCSGASAITRFTLILKNKITAQLYLSAISLDSMNFVFSPPVYFPPASSKAVSFNTTEMMCEYPGQILQFEKVIFYYRQGAIEDIAQVGSVPLMLKCS